MRRPSTLFLLVCMIGCSTSSFVDRSSPSAPASPFVGRWSPSVATSQPYLASTTGFQLALDVNGVAVTRAVVIRTPTTQPATVVREMKQHGTWSQTSPTTAELCLNGSDDRATARLVSHDKVVISAPKTPDIELQRDR